MVNGSISYIREVHQPPYEVEEKKRDACIRRRGKQRAATGLAATGVKATGRTGVTRHGFRDGINN
jgi:hypothetical protein